MAYDNHTSTENQITDENAAIIREMERNGITKLREQPGILESDHGVKISEYIIS
jgi:hypothetical protein